MLKDIIAYIIYRYNCIHPFRISRILVLANWKYIERHGKPFVRVKVDGFKAGFYIEEVKKVIDSECFVKDEVKKCIKYICPQPQLSEDIKNVLEEVIKETVEMDDVELNRLVIKDKRYPELLKKGGFIE